MINGDLRRKNADKIAGFATQTAPEMLWRGVVFHAFKNNAVESAFADHRTYVFDGKEVDRQVHLGFDLASFAGTPIVAANRGKVLFADELGIYGNCVIIDHGMGVQSLYGHLSSIDGEGRAGRGEGTEPRPQRHDRARRRRSPSLHHARQRAHGESGRVVGRALDHGSDSAEAADAGRHMSADERDRRSVGRESRIISGGTRIYADLVTRDADLADHITRDADLADHNHTGRGSARVSRCFVLLSRV